MSLLYKPYHDTTAQCQDNSTNTKIEQEARKQLQLHFFL